MSSHKHWFIAGQGSVGSFIAYNALISNLECTQIVRKSLTARSAIQFHPVNGESMTLPTAASLEQLSVNSIAYLIVPLKAYDIIPFLQQALPYLTDDAAVILCHNGLGTIELATDLLSENMDLYFCTTSNGLYKNSHGVFQAGIGDSFWSHVAGKHPNKLKNDDLIPIFNRISQVTDLQKILWQKLVINCAINPLTAINQVKNGELAYTTYSDTITAIVNETVTVANQVGVVLDTEEMLDKVYQVIENTSANYSSMYQDVLANKKNEIDFITGHVIKLATQLNITCPVSNSLYQQVKSL